MSFTTFFRFNMNLFANLNFPKCHVHSMLQICNKNIETNVGRHVKIQGWIHAVRKMKDNIFVDIMDGSTPKMLQVVIPKSEKPEKLSYGCSIRAEGTLALSPNGRIELHANNVAVIGSCDVMDGYPFAPRKQYPEDYVRQYLHLRPRTRKFSSLLRLRDLASATFENYLRNKGFISMHTPVLTSNDCEGAGELFLVKPDSKDLSNSMRKEGLTEEESYFNTKTFLTVSGQLHLEAVSRAFTKVYTFGPTFRAENSKSRLHLSEFRMLEAELAFVNDINVIMDEVELMIKYVLKEIFEKGASDIEVIGGQDVQWLTEKFARITYDDAIDILQNNANSLEKSITYGDSLSKEHELFLVKRNNNIPVFIINWPKEGKPFYMKECEDDSSKVAAMDLLVPTVGELVGGSIREDDYEKLKSKLPLTTDLAWYLELRKYGNVSTGGFGMGFERFLQYAFNIPNIKDTLPFPRWPHNCSL
ncbi:probable asparagine--tRNA ligase, mitochondrial isoform X1 [Ceratina calcarata]|uniref:asparagine--tRNA ligase n=2 Tax=Ceratina calcarata TaxID=156304 RepID=A0AAJ7JG82_9HYME|nr:probable asparagine--tRNA ligase, mitochondrial isoform X1 [Ceratina calcarata]XP_017892796.1 probable asparagine--tRNA ligase, mitochondrial isoform X1 [Ceratina calcarata]XP_017892797.1 probable asparagine--tRNA ligase, mitochondrial isoform X1 [Ceratina calcarata]XP_026675607.1 probable asparagine--tRNA ligase, mitochondrial isoform X1 [Ceratina calcarata]XP_026675608.1 probable asparagine--tRNA ligase, mitochondrial isoform X1 [Ceratina calcarata]